MSLKRKRLTSVLALLLTAVLSAQTTFAYSNVTLKKGMRSEDVYTLQQDLNELGFMTVKPTGYYGSITKTAVLKMQKQYGLLKDGIAGKQTLGKLDSLMGRKATETKTSEAESADTKAADPETAEGTDEDKTAELKTEDNAATQTAAGEVKTEETNTADTEAAVGSAEDKTTETKPAETSPVKPSEEKTAPKASRGTSRSAESIIDYAKRFMGVKYVWGGTTAKGFDCSGFVKYVYGHFDVSLNRNSAAQAGNGSYIKKANLLPGDLVFFDTNGGKNRVNHVGIYIGNGKMIHSSSSHKGVVISTINSGFYAKSYMTARRVLK